MSNKTEEVKKIADANKKYKWTKFNYINLKNRQQSDITPKIGVRETLMPTSMTTPESRKKPFNLKWFEKAFGFKEICEGEMGKITYECNYDNTRLELLSRITKHPFKINDINMGNFALFDTDQLLKIIKTKTYKEIIRSNNIVRVQNIEADITKLHKELSSKESNATIQVSSKLNCLEMLRPTTLPHAGITIYMEYKTQCSLCSIATPAGLAYRNYLHKNKETLPPPYHVKNPEQINLLAKFLNPIKINRRSIIMRVENGYLFFDSFAHIKTMNSILKNDEFRDNISKEIAIGSHKGLGVCIDGIKYPYLVNHVYCSGIPIAQKYYKNEAYDHSIFDGISEILLDAMYLNTLLIACINNHHNKTPDASCYLTQIGTGDFAMKHEYISNAIIRACNFIANNGLSLNVKIVHEEFIPENADLYIKIEGEYTSASLNDTNMLPSIWDDTTWIKLYAS